MIHPGEFRGCNESTLFRIFYCLQDFFSFLDHLTVLRIVLQQTEKNYAIAALRSVGHCEQESRSAGIHAKFALNTDEEEKFHVFYIPQIIL